MGHQVNPEQNLQRAALAWRDLNVSEGHIARIKRYPKQTPAMTADLERHSQTAAEARKVLDGALKVAP